MKFGALLEEFFKHYKSILGTDPHFQASFQSVSEFDEYADFSADKERGATKKLPKEFTSPYLPLDYTKEEQEAVVKRKKEQPIPNPDDYGPDKRDYAINRANKLKYTPFNEPWQELIEGYDVIEDYDLNIELKLIEIRRAAENENYKLRDIMLYIKTLRDQWWISDNFHLATTLKTYDGTVIPAIHIPIEIIDDMSKWMQQRHLNNEEITDVHKLLLKIQREYSLERDIDIYQRLLWFVSGLEPYSSDIDIRKYITDKIAGDVEPKTEKVETDQPSNYPPRTIKVKEKREEWDNKFDRNTFKDIYDHFKVLVPKHLSEEELTRYIWGAFHHQKKCNSFTFDHFNNKKGHIQDVWVQYYKKSHDSHANKELFIPLLSDYFKEFDTKKMLADYAEGNTNFK